MPEFDFNVSVAVAIRDGGPDQRRFVLRSGKVTAEEGEGLGYGLEAIADSLEQAAADVRESARKAAA